MESFSLATEESKGVSSIASSEVYSMWEYEQCDKLKSKFPRYKKRHPAETLAVVDNLDTFQSALLSGANPMTVHFGFLHREPKGVCAIDQSGGGDSMHESRLYVFPDESEKVIYLITVGDKNSQSRDISDCKRFVEGHRKGSS